ncbi:MAG: pantoate--beta-alanine ligase [Actinomycetota bacterium]|nr:pantoate--beta-alanine ligase [Actinomycetota bacterium]
MTPPVAVVHPAGSDEVEVPDGLDLLRRGGDLVARLEAERSSGRVVGLVPTMGALHAGHRALISRAASECDVTVVTVFVNPLQFGDAGDLATYPRTLATDLAVARAAGASVVFAPEVVEMYPSYPEPPATSVSVAGISDRWEGAWRPGHFDGVATVVAKLFALAGRCRAYFGEKDYQQLAVVRRLASDLSFPVEVVSCPIVREPDGLALSSRNVRLGPDERQAATALWRGLEAGARALAKGERRPESVAAAVSDEVEREPLAQLEYAALVRADDLEPAATVDGGPLRLLVAARVGSVRLIDNVDPQDEDLVRCCRRHDDGASHERPVATGPQGKGGV